MTLLKLLNLIGYQVFETEEPKRKRLVTNHAIKRAEQRIHPQSLLKMVSECALEYGNSSVYFDYKVRKNETGVFAKKYKGYIFVFSKNKKLLTVYAVNNIADIMITRK